jgi:hypothetical protein
MPPLTLSQTFSGVDNHGSFAAIGAMLQFLLAQVNDSQRSSAADS